MEDGTGRRGGVAVDLAHDGVRGDAVGEAVGRLEEVPPQLPVARRRRSGCATETNVMEHEIKYVFRIQGKFETKICLKMVKKENHARNLPITHSRRKTIENVAV